MMTTKAKMVEGVDLSKVNLVVLKASYEKVMGRDAEAETSKLIEEMSKAFRDDLAKRGVKDVLECDTCGGGSPDTMFPDACPFCGDGDDEDADDIPTKATKTNGKSAALSLVKPSPTEIVKATKASVKKTSTVKVVDAKLMTRDVKELDEALMRLQIARDASASSLWTLAVELRNIYDGDLWKLRNDDKGAPKYKSFSKFIVSETDMVERTAYRLIDVAKTFKEEHVEKFGVTMLRVLVSAPEEDREELMAKVESGDIKGTRGVEREVKAIRERKGVKVRENDKKPRGKLAAEASKAAAEKAAERAARKLKFITVSMPVGRKRVKLNARADKQSDEGKPAKRMADQPWGKLECDNGVNVYFAVRLNSKKELELTVEARREE